MTELLQKRSHNYQGFIRRVIEIENQLTRTIQESRREMTKKYSWGDLGPTSLKMVENIYFNEQFDRLRGLDASKLVAVLKRDELMAGQKEKLLENYNK